jgi:hypothetical protein
MKSWVAGLLLFSVSGCMRVSAQSEAVAARLSGTVLDPGRNPVPVARVTLASPDTGLSRQFLTGDDGTYSFTALTPGRYQLKVEKQGFATYLRPEVVLTVGQATNVDPALELGVMNQVIEVTADAPLLNSGNANIGLEVSAKQLIELPLNIRNVYNLVELSSGVSNNTEYQGLT